ncbi:MAG TPA: type II toxin-antitoxin system RelE/ParE family toxin [Rhodopila sp.]|nr:type II toxin-antitoxin system RelE/ParE family toxin [Rhodopila sp.]
MRLIEDDDARALRRDPVTRTRNILAVLIAAVEWAGVRGPPGWHIHQLRGDRAGTWRMSVSGNRRITFEIDEGNIANRNLEGYH